MEYHLKPYGISFANKTVVPVKRSIFIDYNMNLTVAGDLITSMQKFVTMIGWKTEMVDLVTKEEGEFKIVSTVNPVYTNFQHNDKTCYNDCLNGTNPMLKIRGTIGDIKEYCIGYSKKHTLRIFVV